MNADPMLSPGMYFPPSNDQQSDNITRRRWESDEHLERTRLQLSSVEWVNKDGQLVLQPKTDLHGKQIPPLLNSKGVDRVMLLLYSLINPTVALTNTPEEMGRENINVFLEEVVDLLVENSEPYGLDTRELGAIISIVRPLAVAQFMRGVSGFEAKNSKPQMSSSETIIRDGNPQGFKLPSFGGGK